MAQEDAESKINEKTGRSESLVGGVCNRLHHDQPLTGHGRIRQVELKAGILAIQLHLRQHTANTSHTEFHDPTRDPIHELSLCLLPPFKHCVNPVTAHNLIEIWMKTDSARKATAAFTVMLVDLIHEKSQFDACFPLSLFVLFVRWGPDAQVRRLAHKLVLRPTLFHALLAAEVFQTKRAMQTGVITAYEALAALGDGAHCSCCSTNTLDRRLNTYDG
jgi:hypothetical protein